MIEAFKGKPPERLFFGPFESGDGHLSYGSLVDYHSVMYVGDGMLAVEYACVFNGEKVQERCDYGVRVNAGQVRLPRSVRIFPALANDELPHGNRWVRRGAFLGLLRSLAGSLSGD